MVLLAILLSVVAALSTLSQPLILNAIVGAVQQGEPIVALAVVAGLLLLTTGAVTSLQQYVLLRVGEGVVLESRRRLITSLLRLPIVEFDHRRSGDLVSRVSSDTTLLRLALTQGVLAGVGGVVTIIGALVALILLDLILLGLTLLVVAFFSVVTVALARGVRGASLELQSNVGLLTASLDRALTGIRTIRAANATDREEAALHASAKASWRAGVKFARASSVIEPMSILAMQAALLIVLGVGGFRVTAGELPVQDLISFLMFVFLLISPLGQIFSALGTFGSSLGAMDRLREIEQLPTEEQLRASGGQSVPDASHGGYRVGKADRAGAKSLTMANVSFSYPPNGLSTYLGENDVLKDVCLTVDAGSKVALVGPSGAGKTTLLSLIVGFYNVDSGSIVIGGRDASSMTAVEMRRGVSYVEQDSPVLPGSIKDNLTISSPHVTDEDCWRALDAVALGDLVRSSGGLNSPVGELGSTLSGGERQRLAISRAVLSRPQLLLLDESTSNLDSPTEALARQAIGDLAQDCTLVIVAHRLSTVVDADMIVVCDRGRLVASGTHDELLADSELYRDLSRNQLLV